MHGIQDIDSCGNMKMHKAAHVDGILVTYGGSVHSPL